MSIVTKTGDQGETGLFNGQRVKKSDLRMEVLGDLDELSSQLGFTPLQDIQRDLFELGALIGSLDPSGTMTPALSRIETAINELEPALPPLRNFVLPGGNSAASHLHLARAVCRRAERHLSALSPLPMNALPYLNRLSDYLFLLARAENIRSGTPEIIWRGGQDA